MSPFQELSDPNKELLARLLAVENFCSQIGRFFLHVAPQLEEEFRRLAEANYAAARNPTPENCETRFGWHGPDESDLEIYARARVLAGILLERGSFDKSILEAHTSPDPQDTPTGYN